MVFRSHHVHSVSSTVCLRLCCLVCQRLVDSTHQSDEFRRYNFGVTLILFIVLYHLRVLDSYQNEKIRVLDFFRGKREKRTALQESTAQ